MNIYELVGRLVFLFALFLIGFGCGWWAAMKVFKYLIEGLPVEVQALIKAELDRVKKAKA